ncbi:type II toxin-antitoxin system RelE/ParE family toxin [Chryseobacterium indoltheticum]|uniref:type II toxin-antitoxin system RelE/ParE family toxin n=1 Tax=Chryseobacterium indoltheticum TaxID=254 RepID=UPI003F49A1C2
MKEKKFLPEELLKIAEIIEPENFLQSLKEAEKELDEGKYYSHSDVMKISEERFLKNMEIRWSNFALQDLEQIEDYIGNRFTYREYQKFMEILNRKIELILDRKVIFQKLEQSSDYNKLLITEQTTLIYKLETKYLKILRLYNNYQDEDKKFVIDDL